MNIYGQGLLIRDVHKLTDAIYDLNQVLLESYTALTYEYDKDEQVARVYLQDKLVEKIPLGYYYKIIKRYNSVFTLNPEPIVDVYNPKDFQRVSDSMVHCNNRFYDYYCMQYDGKNFKEIQDSFGLLLDEDRLNIGDAIVKPVRNQYNAFVINKELFELLLVAKL